MKEQNNIKARLKSFARLVRGHRRLCPAARESLQGAELDYARLLNLESAIRHELSEEVEARIRAHGGTLGGYTQNSPELYARATQAPAAMFANGLPEFHSPGTPCDCEIDAIGAAVIGTATHGQVASEDSPIAKQCAANGIPDNDDKEDFESIASLVH